MKYLKLFDFYQIYIKIRDVFYLIFITLIVILKIIF